MGITAAPSPTEEAAGESSVEPMPFKFVAWGGSADVSFWHRLADFKLDTQKLTEEPIAISGKLLNLSSALYYCAILQVHRYCVIDLLCDMKSKACFL